MNKELYVSSTPHETKVGITEDDQLAEIYLERENEYTLAGSIYKGRVTRVLPGMQSAFVDIGLERDAFLYVSDFMDLEQHDEDLEEVPANRTGGEARPPRAAAPSSHLHESAATDGGDTGVATQEPADAAKPLSEAASPADGSRERGWRGRRRRRGRRGERFEREERNEHVSPEPHRMQSQHSRTGRDYDYGPPPGYQPIILPGESISKYRKQTSASTPHGETLPHEESASASNSTSFPLDEPMFAAEPLESVCEEQEPQPEAEQRGEFAEGAELAHEALYEEGPEERDEKHHAEAIEDALEAIPHEADFFSALHIPLGAVEEQEIEEEEADAASYVEDLAEDAAYDEMEEETQAAADFVPLPHSQDLAASVIETDLEHQAPDAAEHAEADEEEEADAEELELEEAQAEAEALLEAEAIGNGTVDASAEVRSPAPSARYQRAHRQEVLDRRRGRRGGRRFRRRENQVVPQINDLLKEGQEILVQIAKEPIGKKGARITSHVALPGRFLVYMPTVNHTGVSRKISSEEERQRLKRIILSERENGHSGGFIVRTAAAGATDEELRADIRFLKNLWSEITSRSESSKPPALIYHDLNVVERVLRDQVTSDFSVIWVDTEQEYERILRFANRFQPALVKRVKLYTKETPLYEQFGLNEEINKALKSKVWLKSGGYIVINQTEALVAIDVNTGKYVGKTARLEDTIVKTNVDAIREIVRQVRLRDLGGIIVIDFIDMDERRNRQKVMQALEEALRADRAPSKVLQFNDFGLVAITRKRVKQSLERTIGSPCPYCQATGFVKAVGTICNEVYVEMRKIANHLEHSDVMLRVHPDVAKALKANNARLLNEMEEMVKKTIIVKSDPALHQEQFDIH